MAEETDHVESNLCAPVDSFEQFQVEASSMFEEVEENDFITLSDIVPDAVGSDLTNDSQEIPYDNEVEVDVCSNLNQPFIEIQQSGIEISNYTDEPAENTIDEAEIPPSVDLGSLNVKVPATRLTSRRKNKSYENEFLTFQQTLRYPSKSDSVMPIRPGRKSKTAKNRQHKPICSNGTDTVNKTPSSAKRSSRGKRKIEQIENATPDSTNITNGVKLEKETGSTEKKRRGRPKKMPPEQSLTKDDSNPIEQKISEKVIVEPVEAGFSKTSHLLLDNANIVDSKPLSKRSKKKTKKRGKTVKSIAAKVSDTIEQPSNSVDNTKDDLEDDEGDLSLSQLKQTLNPDLDNIENDIVVDDMLIDNELTMHDPVILDSSTEKDIQTEDTLTQNVETPIIPPVTSTENQVQNETYAFDSLLVEDTSKKPLVMNDSPKRPVRARTKKPIIYEEDSDDEDPYANNSEDDYVPGGKQKSSSSDSDTDVEELEGINKAKRFKNLTTKSANRNIKQDTTTGYEIDITTIEPDSSKLDDDIEGNLQSSVIKPAQKWGNTNEFENFIAQKMQGTNLKIKKVTNTEVIHTPLEIPVLDAANKTVEMYSQTERVKKLSVSVQTTSANEVSMKDNVDLTPEQSENACDFLKSIVKTTSELGQLMTEKSDDFIAKKINTSYVTDTFKMDYCIKKSFLLLKLAKTNLAQMEEDLSNQYEEFLKNNKLIKHREEQKKIAPSKKPADSDSDCEIVEGPSECKTAKPKFNPKTVFLNKELSIKIAKKPTPALENKSKKQNLNIKGRHTVWLSDSVMVKKVKPNQSFLAQDSRNKKPPDCFVTEKMVSDFFTNYYHQKAFSHCAPLPFAEPFNLGQNYICSYFFVKYDNQPACNTDGVGLQRSANMTVAEEVIIPKTKVINPESLLSLCVKALQYCLFIQKSCDHTFDTITDVKKNETPETLFRLCLKTMRDTSIEVTSQPNQDLPAVLDCNDNEAFKVLPLKVTCYKNLIKLLSFDKNTEKDKHSNYTELEVFSSSLSNSDSEYAFENICCDTQLIEFNEMQTKNGIKSLFSLCVELLQKITKVKKCTSIIKDDSRNSLFKSDDDNNLIYVTQPFLDKVETKGDIKSLLSICVEEIRKKTQLFIQTRDIIKENPISNRPKKSYETHSVDMLKHMALENIKQFLYNETLLNEQNNVTSNGNCAIVKINQHNNVASVAYDESHIVIKEMLPPKIVKRLADICFEIISKYFNDNDDAVRLTINSVNTLSEEAFHNIEEEQENPQFSDEDTSFYNDDDFNTGLNEYEDHNQHDDNNWVTNVKLKELKSFQMSNKPTSKKPLEMASPEQATGEDDIFQNFVAGVKIEPEEEEEAPENVLDASIVKAEPLHHQETMQPIPENVVTKQEREEFIPPVSSIQRQDDSSYDEGRFETFVSTNKMQHAFDDPNINEDGIYSQSALRVRRQYEPDPVGLDNDFDPCMSLLVPQTFEPIQLENAKESLMDSSSGDEDDVRKSNKKKMDRRSRGRPRKNESQTKQNNKETLTPKEKQLSSGELAMLTRKMRDKIRQEEKKVQSSDSDSELPLNRRRDTPKTRKGNNDKPSTSNTCVESEIEIQCNNVDSTERIENIAKVSPNETNNFVGFSAVDQNEITSYQKYVKYVYDQILPKVTAEAEKNVPKVQEDMVLKQNSANIHDDRVESPLINYDDPVEMLECAPILPFFDSTDNAKPTAKKPKAPKTTAKNSPEKYSLRTQAIPNYTDRNGWKCYPIDVNDSKLCQKAAIILEKLPESFVETYFRYQDVTNWKKDDSEVDRLINLHTLNRSAVTSKDSKGRSKSKVKVTDVQTLNVSRSVSPFGDDNYNELVPSEDEGANVEDELPPSVRKQTSENHIAKNSLMNDDETDGDETSVKEELDSSQRKSKSKKKSAQEERPNSDSLMLTADKMMNKELNLLHAPIVMKEEVLETSPTGNVTKKKSGTKRTTRDRTKNDDDSSSEEEKQWVSTKEKLLKRLGKKTDTATEDDAKRAKLVNEFITRRADQPGRHKKSGKKRRNSRKILEREKQLRVLSYELFGEGTSDASHMGNKNFTQSYFKGRRNIRKVIDKKSLARSTVIANMEEFERKRRLAHRQAKLRQYLGCEEGVNVLVINDEVCLEYDFEQRRPVVTVHPFFTKVMKAHQYEGVKFMWDACFESLDKISSNAPGSGGGGCILAHCMGLGKTLQVLALLHTVLTHPRVGMQRVLVCCPLSTVLNWVDEIHKWIGPVTGQIKVFELSKLKKTYERAYQLEDWYSGGGIFIIGYELFRSLTTLDPEIDEVRPTIINKIRTALLDPGPDIIVCDEGHLLKNDGSVLAMSISRVATKRRIVLTGTPMQNNLREYYCMVNFIKPNLLGTYSEYSNRFENPIMNGQHRDSQQEDIKLMKQRTHILHKVLEGCLQRQEASVLYPYLPKKHEYTVFISPSKCQWDMYKHYLENYAKQSIKQSILKDFHTLQKIWSHPQVLHNFQMRSIDGNKLKREKLEDDLAAEDLAATEDIKPDDTEMWWLQYLEGGNALNSLEASNKFVVLFRILDECISLGDKVLIFSTSLISMDSLEYFLKKINKWSLGQEYYRLDGTVPPEVRQKWCREFNAENNLKTKLFLISTRAGCLGLNMVAANRVIILDTSWNPAHDIQSIFRVYRFGQKKDCYIYRLVAMGTMEQKIYERAVTKQAIACRVVDEQQIDRHYNMAELTALYNYDETGACIAGGVAVGVTDVALLRVARLPALHAVHEHDSLLRGSSEQALNEVERDAAWTQFQEEHKHKQMQNHLTSSFSLHIPSLTLPDVEPLYKHPPLGESSNTAQPLVKTEHDNDQEYTPQLNTEDKGKNIVKYKRKSVRKKGAHDPVKQEKVPEVVIEESMVQKIMNILIKHNFQDRNGPKEIAQLIKTVRKIVAYGYVPTGSFNKVLTQSIANVLLGKDENDGLPDIPKKHGRVGRSKKNLKGEEDNSLVLEEQSLASRKQKKVKKQSLASKKQKKAPTSDAGSCIDLDTDTTVSADDWQNVIPVDDWQNDVISEEDWRKDDIIKSKQDRKLDTNKAQKQLNSEMSSILLSDDDEPVQEKTSEKADTSKQVEEEKTVEEERIPLHASLLNNQNFINIVAHTYLQGNPMLDPDAAALAAQYSTLKAKKEIEAGNQITSGPIYDIAIKVLGINMLKRLQKTNPKVSDDSTFHAAPVSQPETDKSKESHKSKDNNTKEKPIKTEEKTIKKEKPSGPLMRLKANIAEFIAKPAVKAEPKTSAVPVGMFSHGSNFTAAPQVHEESILPDDDDIVISDTDNIIGDDPTPPPSKLKPIVVKKHKTLPTIKISAGKIIIPTTTTDTTSQIPPVKTQSVVAPSSSMDTICLDDSDEETPPKQKIKRVVIPVRKRVALKSTAKLSVIEEPEPVPVAITKSQPPPSVGVVPIALTKANHNPVNPFNVPLGQQMNLQQPSEEMLSQLPPLPPNQNYYVIPASQFNQMYNTQRTVPTIVNAFSNQQALYPTMPSGSTMNRPILQQHLIPNTMPPMTSMNTAQPMNLNTAPPIKLLNETLPPYTPPVVPQMQHINLTQQTPQSNLVPVAPKPASQPVAPKPGPKAAKKAPAGPKSVQARCKPGDILRITETGEVEILTSAPNESGTPKEDSLTDRVSHPIEEPVPSSSNKGKDNKKRRRKESTSSSSSARSRSSSPETNDPLSILKDVVQIKSVDDILGSNKRKIVTNKVSSITKDKIITPTAYKAKKFVSTLDKMDNFLKADSVIKKTVIPTQPINKNAHKPNSNMAEKQIGKTSLTKSVTKLMPTTQQNAKSLLSNTNSNVTKQIRDSGSALKALGSVLKPDNKAKSQASTKHSDVIDLDDDDIVMTPSTNIQRTTQNKPLNPAKIDITKKPTKIIGTSKNIIISGPSKKMSMINTKPTIIKTSASKDIRVVNVKAESVKRPATSEADAPKKIKSAPMTLKDFNIDDIDDIIELD